MWADKDAKPTLNLPLAPSTRLGPYEILAPLAAGGMGEVYRARDPRMGREVAINRLSGAVQRSVRARSSRCRGAESSEHLPFLRRRS